MTMDELLKLVVREREKVKWHYKHVSALKQRYDIEEKLQRAIEVLRIKAEKPKILP